MRLDKQGRDRLDGAILEYLQRGPVSVWSVFSYAELHTTSEVNASLRRLEKKRLAESYEEPWLGWLWRAVPQSTIGEDGK